MSGPGFPPCLQLETKVHPKVRNHRECLRKCEILANLWLTFVSSSIPAAADDAPAGDRGHLAIEGRVVDPPRHAGGGVGVQVYLLRQLHDGAVVGRFEGALAPRMLVSGMLHLASDLYVSREWLPPRSHMGQIMGPDSYLKPDM